MKIRFARSPRLPGPLGLLGLLGLGVAAAGLVQAAALPPADARPLSQILDAVVAAHPGVVVSAEFDEGRWEVLSCDADGRRCRELRVDPRSAKTLRSSVEWSGGPRPPADGRTAAQIARAIEERGLGTITELEFDAPLWELELRGTGVRAKLYVDPVSGEIQRCRGQGCPAR